jgi:hypothetical protein
LAAFFAAFLTGFFGVFLGAGVDARNGREIMDGLSDWLLLFRT